MIHNKHPPLDNGQRILTTQSLPDANKTWYHHAIAKRKWGVLGTIFHYHDSHGLSYEVRHDDGTKACYKPGEFELQTATLKDFFNVHFAIGLGLACKAQDLLR